MKATLCAVALALTSFSLSLYAAEAPQPSSKINLNTADIQALTGSFQRIGKMRAAAIIKYRQVHGRFKSVAELAQVHGLGQAFVMSHLPQLQTVFTAD